LIKKDKMAAAVILYNPTDEMLSSIRSYANDVSAVYAIDNSETPSPALEAKLRVIHNIQYTYNGGNLGIANALNRGAAYAIQDGYEYLLTMDQDSDVQSGMIQAMLDCLAKMDSDKIGIISPVQAYACASKGNQDKPCEEIVTAMTSGNLLNLKAYQAVGPFRNDFFIDRVDDEYCLRLHLHGFRVLRANKALLQHRIGNITEHCFFFKKFAISNHSALRRYYSARNSLYLRARYKQHYPDYFRNFYWKILKEIAIILLYEYDKTAKIVMILKGYLDYRNGITGKFQPK
jgi:rhamnosyltransferase